MGDANLLGVRLKIERAKQHFDHLCATIQSWGSTEPEDHHPAFDYDPDRKCMHITIQKVRPNNPDWALIAGDVVHNLRSALDHLVCQLAILNGQLSSCCNKTSFPICLTEPVFLNSKARADIAPLIHPDALTRIEELQPYQAAKAQGKDPSRSNLWIVSQLDIIDKHRMLVVAAKHFRASELTVRVNDGAPIPVDCSNDWKPLKDGAQIATVDLSAFPLKSEDKVSVEAQTELQVFFNETGCGCDGLPIEAALAPCINYVSAIIDLFAPAFRK